jgi:hypothetical protein
VLPGALQQAPEPVSHVRHPREIRAEATKDSFRVTKIVLNIHD